MGVIEAKRIVSWILATWPRRSRRRNPIEELHAFFAERLTDSGKAVALLWLVSLALATIPGWSPVKLLFPMLTSVLAVSLVATFRAPRVSASLLEVGEAVAGRRAKLRFRIQNLSDRRSSWVGVGLFRAGEGLASREVLGVLESIAPGAFRDIEVQVECLSRGPTGFPGVGVVRLDPFGLAKARRIEFTPIEFAVAPAVLRIAPGRFLFEGASGRAFAEAAGIGSDLNRVFQGVRAFREGDRLRDLDHKAWARWNTPVVREFSSSPRGGIALHVDTGCDGLLERAALESMIRLACGIAVEFCRQGWLGALFVDGRPAEIGLGSESEVAAVFARIPRCGWGAWPEPGVPATCSGDSRPMLVIGVSKRRIREADPGGAPCKRLVVGFHHQTGMDGDAKYTPADSLDSGDVSL